MCLYTALLSLSELVKQVHNVVDFFSVGHPREDTLRGPRLHLRNVQPFLDCLVLMLCHRPVHTQTHVLSCSALTLSLASSTTEIRGNHVSLSYTSTYRISRACFHFYFPQIYFVAKAVPWLAALCQTLVSPHTLYIILHRVSKKLADSSVSCQNTFPFFLHTHSHFLFLLSLNN